MVRTLVGIWAASTARGGERIRCFHEDGAYVAVLDDGREFGPYVREIDSVRAVRAAGVR